MVAEWGMSDKFGLVSYGEGNQIFVGRDYQRTQGYSEEVARAIDEETRIIVETAHKKALEILKEKKDLIESLTNILLEKETIYHEEFKLLYDGTPVEEVVRIMDETERAKKKYQEEAKQSAIVERKNKEIASLLETAEASLRVGLISQKDLENIKKELENSKEETENATKNVEDTQNNQSTETNDESEQDGNK